MVIDTRSDLNLTILRGSLATAAELREFESGSRYLKLLVTVRCEEPRRRIDVVPVVLWDPPDELADAALGPETRVFVVGSTMRRFDDGPNGQNRRLEVVADEVVVVRDGPAWWEDGIGSLPR